MTLMLGEHATKGADAVAAPRAHHVLDRPFLVRYFDYVGRLAARRPGRSIQQNRPVAIELADCTAGNAHADGGRATDRDEARLSEAQDVVHAPKLLPLVVSRISLGVSVPAATLAVEGRTR